MQHLGLENSEINNNVKNTDGKIYGRQIVLDRCGRDSDLK